MMLNPLLYPKLHCSLKLKRANYLQKNDYHIAMSSQIRIYGARQNNLKNLDLSIDTGEILVLTGVSGSGKSSLAFDTLYAEGQRRYVETFSPYARQFLDRMDKPQVDRIEGILPAIAIDQVNPVRNSRSTVGTMTELNDHLKLLYARLGTLFCACCGAKVERDNPESIRHQLSLRTRDSDPRLIITFPVTVPANFTEEEVRGFLDQQGYTRIHHEENISRTAAATKKTKGKPSARSEKLRRLHVIQDRFRYAGTDTQRIMEALDAALKQGNGHIAVYAANDDSSDQAIWRFSNRLHCAHCDIEYTQPLPSSFSFNSPLGACDTCRGFGRVIGIDYGLVVPDETKTLRDGAIKPWQTASYNECQTEMEQYASAAKVRLDTPWRELDDAEKQWAIGGTPDWKGGPSAWKTQWYGAQRFFDWLESRAYKMHVRVLLSKYRSYTACPDCGGSRLKPEATLWRLGNKSATPNDTYPRFMPPHAQWTAGQLDHLPGLSIHDLMRLPIDKVRDFFAEISFGAALDAAIDLLLNEIRTRLKFLCDVGLGYLSLDRQSRTLSGGEVQRINLTTALGTSLVNTLFVLDEPSIGLHPRDMHRIVEIMQRLRDNGNTLVVVEHDPQVMIAADRILDFGPGPGERGGQIIFDGTVDALRHANTLTGNYLSGRLRVEAPRPMPVKPTTPKIVLEGASANNLKNLSISIPLGRLVCISGVSGSGKSTLIQDVLYPAILKQKGKPTEAPGPYSRLLGAEQIADVIMVDQTPIGKTARSNPASYVGAYEAIRKIFAQASLAKERGYTAGMFSFNTGDGRCPTCGGTGFEHVEMQFLSDIYIRCPDCDGKRFRPEILQVRVEHLGRSASIDEVLEMTVNEALSFFSGLRDIQTGLAPLADVGLEYVHLGQPVPTLSGGEAQRLKLAGHLAIAARSGIAAAKVAKKGSLFLFDEPTTGLHFDDIARLMQAFRKLLAAGHSLVIIEHNLDVIGAADWIIDLGPEGGDAGGQIVAAGTPLQLASGHPASYTGRALRDYKDIIVHNDAPESAAMVAEPAPAYRHDGTTPLQTFLRQRRHRASSIDIVNAREHNLKGINVSIPRDTFTVITGVSGSGKSTLAFDILFNEGQRRYLESLNAYARAIVQPAGKPDVDAIYGIPPTVAIEQRTSRGGRKSTVATMTEIHHFLRLLYTKLGTQMCPTCHVAVAPQKPEQIAAQLLRDYKGQHIGLLAPLVAARKGYYTEIAKSAGSKGYTHLRVDGEFMPVTPWPRLDRYTEHTIELPVADLLIDPKNEPELREGIRKALELGQGSLSVLAGLTQNPEATLAERRDGGVSPKASQRHFSVKRACPSCGTSFPEPDPRLFSYNSKHGWCQSCFGTGLQLAGFNEEQTGEETAWNAWYEGGTEICRECHGQRLNPLALAFRWRDRSIAELARLPVSDAQTFFSGLISHGREQEIARDILSEIRGRLNFMEEVGLGYLALDRAAPTLSGGEAQRIRLAAQLGSNMQGVCYILDEPTIGLHSRDNQILLNALSRLERNGNTLVVVEHDEDTIRRAAHIIDMGPGAGTRGGRIVAQGTAQDLIDNPASITGQYLKHPLRHPLQARRPIDDKTTMLEITGAHLHNLHNVQARVPIGRMSVVTGVSGSGKSTLAREVLLDNIARAVSQRQEPVWQGCTGITGWEHIDRVLEVDQTPIGKTPRSCPATYIGFWNDVRKLFAETRDARMRGWTAARFSFNTGDGRCPVCEGQGLRTIEMSFLPDVKVPCDACHGERFNRDTLGVTWRGKSAGEVLKMEVDEAIEYFSAHRKTAGSLQLMHDVGLGYLTLGQPSPTLSGGEAQRIKLVTELTKARLTDGIIKTGRASRLPHTLYVLDEPTVGLSMADVEKLLHVLHRLVDAGNTVVVIEHNLDVIAEADWVLDMGPEGGSGGGRLVAQGSPEHIADMKTVSHTGAVLHPFLLAAR